MTKELAAPPVLERSGGLPRPHDIEADPGALAYGRSRMHPRWAPGGLQAESEGFQGGRDRECGCGDAAGRDLAARLRATVKPLGVSTRKDIVWQAKGRVQGRGTCRKEM